MWRHSFGKHYPETTGEDRDGGVEEPASTALNTASFGAFLEVLVPSVARALSHTKGLAAPFAAGVQCTKRVFCTCKRPSRGLGLLGVGHLVRSAGPKDSGAGRLNPHTVTGLP